MGKWKNSFIWLIIFFGGIILVFHDATKVCIILYGKTSSRSGYGSGDTFPDVACFEVHFKWKFEE